METFYLIAGLFTLILFTIFLFVLKRDKDRPENNYAGSLSSPKKFLLSWITFFQIIGAVWLLFGIALKTSLISYPRSTLGIAIDALLLLVPIWLYAFYLERKEKRRSPD